MPSPPSEPRRNVARFIAGEGETPVPGIDLTQVSKYRVLRLLGRGGSASVYEAMDSELRRKVALKVLREEHADERHVKRFQREASIAAQLQHPNIVPVFEIGIIPQGENRYLHFIAMALVEGLTLDDYLRAERHDYPEIARLIEDAARAADHAHRKGVVHRDLKSANIMVEKGGRVLLMDFGLARATTFESKLTRNAAVLGTPAYMAPEQVKGDLKRIGPASDVYALGIILFEALTGRVPFDGRAAAELFYKVVNNEPPRPSTLKRGVPPELEIVCLKAIEKDPRDRYASAAELAEDLRRFRTGAPILAQPMRTWSRLTVQARRRAPAIVLTLLLMGGAAAVTVALTRKPAPTPVPTSPDDLQREQARAEALQKVALFHGTLQERKRELRALRIPAAQARRDLEAALANVEKLHRERPDLPQTLYLLARGKGYLGRLEEAERDALRLVQRHPDFRPGWSLLGILKIERYHRLRWGFDRTMSKVAVDFETLMVEADEAFAKGWPPGREMEESLRWKLPWSREDEVMGRLSIVARHLRAGRDAEARRELEEAMGQFQAEEYALWMIRFFKEAKPMIEWLDRSIELAPGYSTAIRIRAMVRKTVDEHTAAIKDFDRALDLEPGDPDLLVSRAQSKEDLRDRDGAMRDLEEALSVKPDHFGALNNRGTLKAKEGDIPGAMADFDAALATGFEDAGTLCNRARCRQALGRPNEALQDINRALELVPNLRTAYTLRGRIRKDLGDVPGAFGDYTRAIKNENDLDAAYYRAVLHQERGDFPSALADLNLAMQHPQPLPETMGLRGFVHMRLEHFDAAERDLSAALRAAPVGWPQRKQVQEWLESVRQARR